MLLHEGSIYCLYEAEFFLNNRRIKCKIAISPKQVEWIHDTLNAIAGVISNWYTTTRHSPFVKAVDRAYRIGQTKEATSQSRNLSICLMMFHME